MEDALPMMEEEGSLEMLGGGVDGQELIWATSCELKFLRLDFLELFFNLFLQFQSPLTQLLEFTSSPLHSFLSPDTKRTFFLAQL